MSAVQSVGESMRSWALSRVPRADLDDRDPDYIREWLPGAWLLASLYFRARVRGLERIPEHGPVLLVGNHSGGNMTPDTVVFTLAFCAYFGVERRFYQLAHNLVLSMPHLSWLRKYGTVAASHDNARQALRTGAAVLVYPGGDYEVHRPSWQSGTVDFDARPADGRAAAAGGRLIRVEHRERVAGSVAEVWQAIQDPARYPELFPTVQWRPCEQGQEPELGAQYFARFPVGSTLLGGRVEIVEYSPPGDLAWTSVTGIDHRGRWRLRADGSAITEVSLRVAYDVPGGVLSLAAGYAARPFLRSLLRDAVRGLAAAL